MPIFMPGGGFSLHCCEFGMLVNNLASSKTCPALHSQLLRFMRKIYLDPVTMSHPGLITYFMMVLFARCRERFVLQAVLNTAYH